MALKILSLDLNTLDAKKWKIILIIKLLIKL